MPKITYVESDGNRHEIDVDAGWNLMDGAVKNGVPGIDGDCGGNCACATCHIFVSAEWAEVTGERTEAEQEMLEFAENVQSNSRLACQIEVDDRLDGLVVHLPESQY
ncbi:MAG: 2Fe-2S ferredoxin [Erythrobacteraceae bacterium]|nr:2Fe-2S ferredoxin [Erythrobacteraceae bacterium]